MDKISGEIDVIVIGGGPAGLSAASWCCELGLRTILFEKADEFGGQLLWIHNPIPNYIGRYAKNGAEMCGYFLKSIEKSSFLQRLSAEITYIDAVERTVTLKSGEVFSANSLIIASGISRRKLGVPGEDVFQGKGIISSGSKDPQAAAGKRLLIVGGGDAAFENALIMSPYAEKIYVVHRRSEFSARPQFFDPAKSEPKIEFRTDTEITQINGDTEVRGVELQNKLTGQSETLAVDIVLIRIGVEPNSQLFRGQIDLDTKGYIVTNTHCETSVKNVYAIGDISNPTAPTIATAAGTGSIAAKNIRAALQNVIAE